MPSFEKYLFQLFACFGSVTCFLTIQFFESLIYLQKDIMYLIYPWCIQKAETWYSLDTVPNIVEALIP